MNDLQPIRRNGESFVAKQVENLSLIYDWNEVWNRLDGIRSSTIRNWPREFRFRTEIPITRSCMYTQYDKREEIIIIIIIGMLKFARFDRISNVRKRGEIEEDRKNTS